MRGITVVKVPYTADPEKADPGWAAGMKAGYSEHGWAKEMEMDPLAGALDAIFAKEYRPDKHERALAPDPELPMRCGWDFGQGYPAKVWSQRKRTNALRVLASLVGENVQLRPFCERTIAYEVNELGEMFQRRLDFCDPAGDQHKDDGLKSVEVLREFGWIPKWRTSRVEEGIEALANLLTRDDADGEPMFWIDPRRNPILCHALRRGYRRDAQGVPIRTHPVIDVMDALRYEVVNTLFARRRLTIAPPPVSAIDPISGYGPWGHSVGAVPLPPDR